MTTPTDLHRALAEVAHDASDCFHAPTHDTQSCRWTIEAIAQALAEKMGPIGRYEANTALNFPVAERVEALEASRNSYYDEAAKAFAAVATIIRTYDAYRGMGVLPAPTQYQQVVEAINDARKIMAPQFREASRLLTTKGE